MQNSKSIADLAILPNKSLERGRISFTKREILHLNKSRFRMKTTHPVISSLSLNPLLGGGDPDLSGDGVCNSEYYVKNFGVGESLAVLCPDV